MTLAVLSVIMGGCSLIQSDDIQIEYLAVQLEEDGKWSFVDQDGNIKYPNEFKEIPSSVINGFFSIKEGNGYSLYKNGEKPELVKDCENLKCVGYVNNGLIPIVREKSRITIIETSGKDKFILEPVKGKEITHCSTSFSDGMLVILNEDGKAGYVDSDGKVLIDPKYDSAYDFSEGLALVSSDEVISVINKKGDSQFKLKKGWVPMTNQFEGGVIVVRDNNDHILFMDKKGETVKCPSKVKNITEYNDDYYVFSDGDGIGLMSRKKHEVVIRPKYSSISIMNNGNFLCEDNGEYEICNSKGEVEKQLDKYEGAIPFGQFGIIAKDKKDFLILDDKGIPVKGCEFANINFALSSADIIESDFFNVESLADNLTQFLTADGIEGYKIGSPASSMLKDPKEYRYSSTAKLDSLTHKGYRYEYSVTAEFTSFITDVNYNYYSYSYDPTYSWNSEAKLNALSWNVEAQTELGGSVVKAVSAAAEKKGYKFVESNFDGGNGGVIMKSAKALLVISSTNKSRQLEMALFKLPDDATIKEIVNNLKSAFKEGSESSSEIAVESDAPDTDTVAVAVEDYDYVADEAW